MNDVPLLFAESVVRLFDYCSLSSLRGSRSSLFGNVSRSLWEKRLDVTLNVVYNQAAGTFDYCMTCTRDYESFSPYTFNPADHRFVFEFKVNLLRNKRSLDDMDVDVTWTTATQSDPTFLKLLTAPYSRTELCPDVKCRKLLKMLPDYCTFNYITAYDYNDVLDAIIQRSQACGRLERVYCAEFFKKRGMEASIEWIATNKRLRSISSYLVENPESARSVLNTIGVQ